MELDNLDNTENSLLKVCCITKLFQEVFLASFHYRHDRDEHKTLNPTSPCTTVLLTQHVFILHI